MGTQHSQEELENVKTHRISGFPEVSGPSAAPKYVFAYFEIYSVRALSTLAGGVPAA
jgi:hypothetical protein